MPEPSTAWTRDRVLWGALVVGLVLRVAPLVLWPGGQCTRDECTYQVLARAIVAGRGLTTPEEWLWAPGHPYLLAVFLWAFGTVQAVKGLEIVLAVLSIALMYRIAERVADRGAARWAAWLYAVHPTLVYFTGTLWSEVIYAFLLLGAVLGLLWSRDGRWTRALLPGVLVGLCVLFRGVATYMAPVFAIAALWPVGEAWPDAWRRRWRHAIAVVAAIVLTVAPYSVTASLRHGGLIISDATLGQMMWLGNNDFAPVTFDYGNGMLQSRAYTPLKKTGRPHCAKSLPAAQWDRCEVRNGVAWIRAHPEAFVRRVPMRLAQLLDPHTFLTRHVRWGKWPGLPFEVREGLCAYVALTSFLVVIGGTIAAWARAAGPFGALSVGIVGYHVLAIAMLAGLSRYRLPLEPLWMIWLAAALASPRATWRALRSRPGRLVAAAVTVLLLLPLMLWYLPAGIPGLW